MPSIVTNRKKRIVRARVKYQGIVRIKKYPDDSRKSYRAAVIWEENERERLRKEFSTEIPTEYISVEKWAEEYLNDAKTRYVKKTYQEKKAAFDNLAAAAGITGYMAVDDIPAETIARLLQDIKNTRSGHAANKVRKNLGAGWSWGAAIWKRTWPAGVNPFLSIDKMPEEKAPRYVPPLEDFWKVHQAADNLQDQTMLMAFLQTAARRGEIFRLTLSDLDFAEMTVRLWTRKRSGGLEFDIIPMTDTLKSALLAWLKFRMALDFKDKEHVFVCLDNTPYCQQYYGRPFQKRSHLVARLCKKAGVPAFGFHAIRHLTATALYHQGVPVKDIQVILRHQAATTTDRYLKSLGLIQDKTRAALDKIGSGPAQVIPLPSLKTNKN